MKNFYTCFIMQTNADGESSCDFTTCDAAPTATAVEAFAASNQVIFPRPFFLHLTNSLVESVSTFFDLSILFCSRQGVDICLHRGLHQDASTWLYRAF